MGKADKKQVRKRPWHKRPLHALHCIISPSKECVCTAESPSFEIFDNATVNDVIKRHYGSGSLLVMQENLKFITDLEDISTFYYNAIMTQMVFVKHPYPDSTYIAMSLYMDVPIIITNRGRLRIKDNVYVKTNLTLDRPSMIADSVDLPFTVDIFEILRKIAHVREHMICKRLGHYNRISKELPEEHVSYFGNYRLPQQYRNVEHLNTNLLDLSGLLTYHISKFPALPECKTCNIGFEFNETGELMLRIGNSGIVKSLTNDDGMIAFPQLFLF